VADRKPRRIADCAAKHQLPAVYFAREFAEAGGLMSYGANMTDIVQRTASHMDKSLKGAKPGELPLERPIKFELVIDLKTPQALGLTMAPSLLWQADRVIQ
jgi:putative ABC transport system substrate-binding protein